MFTETRNRKDILLKGVGGVEYHLSSLIYRKYIIFSPRGMGMTSHQRCMSDRMGVAKITGA